MVKVKIESSLLERAKRAAAAAGYSSVEEFIANCIEKEIQRLQTDEHESRVSDQLRCAGSGGPNCAGEDCFGFTSGLSLVNVRAGTAHRVVTGLASVADEEGFGATGLDGISALGNGTSYGIMAEASDKVPAGLPADATAKLLGIKEFVDDGAKARFSNLVHWGYGTGWGAARGVLRALGLSAAASTPAHFVSIWGSALVMLPALDVAPPVWRWGRTDVAIDVFHHAVYVAAAALAYEALDSQDRAL